MWDMSQDDGICIFWNYIKVILNELKLGIYKICVDWNKLEAISIGIYRKDDLILHVNIGVRVVESKSEDAHILKI